MEKLYTLLRASVISALLLLLGVMPSAAQISFTEDFNYSEGELKAQSGGKWQLAKSYYSANPVQVIEGELTYDGCPLPATKKVASLTALDGNEGVFCQFTDEDRGATGTFYYAALVQVGTVPETNFAFLSLVNLTKTQTSIATNTIPGEMGRLFVCPGSSENTFCFGAACAGTSPKVKSAELQTETTYLVVAKMELNYDGSEADRMTLYVNPASTSEEPATSVGVSTNAYGLSKGYGCKAVMLNQQLSYGYRSGQVYVGALRVADNYANLFAAGEKQEPELTATEPTSFDGYLFQGISYEGEFTLKGKNLTSDVTLSCDQADLTFARTTIPAAEAMSEEGAKVAYTITPKEKVDKLVYGEITLTTEGLTATKKINWIAASAVSVSSLKEIQDIDTEDDDSYLYTGKALVTFVDTTAAHHIYYMQDEDGALVVRDDYDFFSSLKKGDIERGDSITNMVLFSVQSNNGVNYGELHYAPVTVLSKKNEKLPDYVTVAELKANADKYLNRYVGVRDVTISATDGATQFTEDMALPTFADVNGESGKVGIFKGTSLIGTAIPAGQAFLSGIFTAINATDGPVVSPRDEVDIVDIPSKFETEIDEEALAKVRGQVGQTTTLPAIHINSYGSTPVTVEVSDELKDAFSLSLATIPAGAFVGDITLTYTPSKVGKDEGYLLFKQNGDVISSTRIVAMAIDPNDPPAVSLFPVSFKTFTAQVGEEVKDTVKVTPYGMPDSINVTLTQSGDNFSVNTDRLEATGEQLLVVTFRPTATGTFEATLTLRNEFLDPVVLRLEGTTISTGIDAITSDAEAAVSIYDAAGRQLRQATGATLRSAMQSLPAGTYIVRYNGGRTVKLSK